MSKSRKFAIPGTTSGSKYVFTFNDNGEVEGVKKQSQLGRPLLSVDPNSTEFQKVTSGSQALEAYNVNNFKGRKDLYKTSTDDIKIASDEQKDNKHATEKKKENNEDKEIDETGEKINGVTTASATTTENKIPILFRYPYDIDTNQDHLKIVQYEYKRPEKREFNASSPNKYGSVISDKNKPYGKYNGKELDYILEDLDSENMDRKANPYVNRLEEKFSEVFQSKYSIAHNSGTSTLHSCLVAAGVKEGDEVISPAHTVIMNSFVTLHMGAIPVYVDIDPDTFNMCPKDLEKKITSKTKAIQVVHMHGNPSDMVEIMKMSP